MSTMTVKLRVAKLIEGRMSQSELARRSGLSLVSINSIVSGEPIQIQLASIDKLCAALNVEPGELFERTPQKRKGKG